MERVMTNLLTLFAKAPLKLMHAFQTLASCVVAITFLLGASAVQAAELIHDPSNSFKVIAIGGLKIDGIYYDVKFAENKYPGQIYGPAPGAYTFDSDEVGDAIEAVNAALNSGNPIAWYVGEVLGQANELSKTYFVGYGYTDETQFEPGLLDAMRGENPDSIAWDENEIPVQINYTQSNTATFAVFTVSEQQGNEAPQDVSAISDIDDDALSDIAVLNLAEEAGAQPVVSLFNGDDGGIINEYVFFNENYAALRMDTGRDGNGDGAADDPYIVVLAENRSTSVALVQTRDAADGSQLRSNLSFYNENYTNLDVAVLDDTNGDGVTDDASIAVLAYKPSNGKYSVTLRMLATGEEVGKYDITKENYEFIAVVGVSLAGGESRLSVLGTDLATELAYVRNIRVADGTTNKQKVAGTSLNVTDLAVQLDGDGNSVADDPAFVILADSNDKSVLRIRDVVSNANPRDISALSVNWAALAVGTSADLSGNNLEDAIVIGINNDDNDIVRMQLRDLQTGDSVGNIDIGD